MNISVIIPLYNAEKYIAKALESCLDLEEVKEIIVIDDAYKDNAVQIVRNYVAKFPQVKLFHHPNNENLGAGASRNLGIEKSTQEFIAFLDADDFYLPNRFLKDKQVFKQYPEADGCYSGLGVYCYSQKAKFEFNEKFASFFTSINPNANPTPENLLGGLLGLKSDFGYFSIDALTLKRKSLKAQDLVFSKLRIHQDTVFIIKLASSLKLYPSQLVHPVAMRGVHEENRITNNASADTAKIYYNRFMMWNELYKWFTSNKKEIQFPAEYNAIYQNVIYFDGLQQNNKSFLNFVKLLSRYRVSLLKHSKLDEILNHFKLNKYFVTILWKLRFKLKNY